MAYTHNEYYSAFKEMEIPTHTTIRMSLEDIMLSEIGQSQQDRCRINTSVTFINMELMANGTRADKGRDRTQDGVAGGCGRGHSGLSV